MAKEISEQTEVSEPAKLSPEEELSQTISVKPPALKSPNSAREVAKRTLLLATISAGIAALIRKTVQPFLIKHQPENLPIKVPDEVGFFASGVLGASALLLIQKKIDEKKQMTRRDFFPVFGAGFGAAVGGMVTRPPSLGPTSTNETNKPETSQDAEKSEEKLNQ